ncbi:MAG: type II toxin-antitoxin system prevent-host-death family antitoxin [Nitrococcus sp.]|nr:type II toxin-antitoxin system prevent-host-death family antitoxin [Nitrococcus sp.]
MQATTKDLRLRANELLAAVDRGEEVVITYRGRRRARLMPVEEGAPQALARNPAFGLWQDRTAEVDSYVRNLRRGRVFE